MAIVYDIDGTTYQAIDRGHTTSSDHNLCFYLSATASSMQIPIDYELLHRRAAQLKKDLATSATLLGNAADNPNFASVGVMAEEQVLRVYAKKVGPICVIQA